MLCRLSGNTHSTSKYADYNIMYGMYTFVLAIELTITSPMPVAVNTVQIRRQSDKLRRLFTFYLNGVIFNF